MGGDSQRIAWVSVKRSRDHRQKETGSSVYEFVKGWILTRQFPS